MESEQWDTVKNETKGLATNRVMPGNREGKKSLNDPKSTVASSRSDFSLLSQFVAFK